MCQIYIKLKLDLTRIKFIIYYVNSFYSLPYLLYPIPRNTFMKVVH